MEKEYYFSLTFEKHIECLKLLVFIHLRIVHNDAYKYRLHCWKSEIPWFFWRDKCPTITNFCIMKKKTVYFRCYSSQPQNIKGIQSNNLFRVCFFDKINYYCRKSHAPQKRSDFLKKKNNDSERINRKIFQFFFYIKDTIRIWWCWSQGSLFSNDILWALWL